MTSKTPLRPRLVFRVGVVGHRPNRLQHANTGILADTLHQLLASVQKSVLRVSREMDGCFSDSRPGLRAVTPLAEGVDRLFADQALSLGYELCCVMPFPRTEFENDFAPERALEPDSLERFRALLARAEKETALTRFELDGARTDDAAAYGAGGTTVLNQSDLLIAVWDGERHGKRGGTEETLAKALRQGVPTVWIDAREPHGWMLLEAHGALPFSEGGQERAVPVTGDYAAELDKVVELSLSLPLYAQEATEVDRHDQTDPRAAVKRFYGERKPHVNRSVIWRFFRDLLGDLRIRPFSLHVADFEDDVQREWPYHPTTALGRVVDSLRPFYAWPDKLAVNYGDAHRGISILAYLLAAAAVGLALAPVAMGWPGASHPVGEAAAGLAELLAIAAILCMILHARRERWHERWIDYRLAAEMVRHLRLVTPLGGVKAAPHVPAQWAAYGHPAATWMAWYVRAAERQIGLPTARMDAQHLDECLAHFESLLIGQVRFHQIATTRCRNIERRLQRFGVLLLTVTLAVCLLHLLSGLGLVRHFSSRCSGCLTFLCGFLPALGAALAGIENQGEYRRVQRRSAAMIPQLEVFAGRVRELRTPFASQTGLRSVAIAALGTEIAQLMASEVLDWRVVFLDRPPVIPT